MTDKSLSRIRHEGVVIGAASTSQGNSIIYLKKSAGFPDDRQPYSVQQISRERNGQIKLHLQAFKKGTSPDPYGDYPLFRAKVWRQNLDDDIIAVDIREFRCHGALWRFNESECVIVMTDRVSVYLLTFDYSLTRKQEHYD
jgi:hypothetical protein